MDNKDLDVLLTSLNDIQLERFEEIVDKINTIGCTSFCGYDLVNKNDIIFIVPTIDKPIKVVYENNSQQITFDNDDIIIHRPLTASEKEALKCVINELNIGVYETLSEE